MQPGDLADWAKSKACDRHRGVDSGHDCNNPAACKQALTIAAYLERLTRFEGTSQDGRRVSGYIIEG